MRKVHFLLVSFSLLILLSGCFTSNEGTEKKVESSSNTGLTKEQVIEKTISKTKTEKGYQWEYKQNTSVKGEASGKTQNSALTFYISGSYVNDKEYYIKSNNKTVENGTVEVEDKEIYTKDKMSYTKITPNKKWESSSAVVDYQKLGYDKFLFIKELQTLKDSTQDVIFQEKDTTYQVDAKFIDSNKIVQLLSSTIPLGTIDPSQIKGTYSIKYTIDKKDLRIKNVEIQTNIQSTVPDKKIVSNLTISFTSKGAIDTISLPPEVK